MCVVTDPFLHVPPKYGTLANIEHPDYNAEESGNLSEFTLLGKTKLDSKIKKKSCSI